MNAHYVVLGKIAVKTQSIVNDKDIIAGSVPSSDVTTNGPYEIVQTHG